jgi:hypothetical protein
MLFLPAELNLPSRRATVASAHAAALSVGEVFNATRAPASIIAFTSASSTGVCAGSNRSARHCRAHVVAFGPLWLSL